MLVMLLQRTFYASPTSTKPPPGASAWAHDVLVTDIRRRFKRSLNQFRGLAFDLSGNGAPKWCYLWQAGSPFPTVHSTSCCVSTARREVSVTILMSRRLSIGDIDLLMVTKSITQKNRTISM